MNASRTAILAQNVVQLLPRLRRPALDCRCCACRPSGNIEIAFDPGRRTLLVYKTMLVSLLNGECAVDLGCCFVFSL